LRVAALAARDEEIGKTIVSAWHAAGSGGEVEIERGRGRSGTTAVSYGHTFETAGYHADLGPLDNGGAKLNNAAVIAGDRLEDAAATSRLLDEALPRPVFVVGRIGEAVRDRLLATRHAGRPVVAAFPPGKGGGHGDALRSFFGDIATLTGGEVYRGRGVLTPGSASLDFGRRRVMLTQPAGNADEVDALRRRLREEIVGESSAHARTVVRHRLAFLARPLVRIEVGAPTLPEAEEALHRYEDALGSVRGAGEDGVLPGGGAALRAVAPMLPATPGGQVLARALGYPLRRLLVNAGVEPGPVIVALDEAGPGFTWDLQRERPALADEIGVLDSAGAVRSALVHAADVAQAIILTDTVLAEREMFWR
jgi:chaperonin GroEL